jgi:hypothetical protein
MGKTVNYLREYKEIKEVEKREEDIYMTLFLIFITLAVTFPFDSDVSIVIFVPFLFTTIFFKLFTVKKLKGRARELGFDSVKEFEECVEGARECLEIRNVLDEVMADEQNRIIEDFVKGKRKRKWKDVPEMFKSSGISIAPPTKFRWNGMMELALSDEDDDEED